jgi:hypothetical protein
MQGRSRPDDPGPRPSGLEAWLPPILLGTTRLALAGALVAFVVVALPLRSRISLPPVMIPAAVATCAILALWMVVQAVLQIRQGVRELKESRKPRIRPR